jgi:hypothetical protein
MRSFLVHLLHETKLTVVLRKLTQFSIETNTQNYFCLFIMCSIVTASQIKYLIDPGKKFSVFSNVQCTEMFGKPKIID